MNAFFVETPMELVCAIEARHRFVQGESILFVHSFYPKSIFQTLLRRDKWDGRRIFIRDIPVNWANFKQSKWRQFVLRAKLDWMIRTVGEANYLFINYHRAHMRHVINRLKHQKLIIIEGGTDALATNALRYIPTPIAKDAKDLSWLMALKGYIRRRFIEFDTREVPVLTFFSGYDLDVRPGDLLVKNHYSQMKQWAAAQRVVNEVLFLGQPLSEDGYMKENKYFSYMGKILEYLGGDNLVYLPHPRESDKIVDRLVDSFGFRVKRYALPIEIQMLFEGLRPKLLCGYCSAAIGNCLNYFGDELKMKAFYIEQQDLLIKHKYIEDVYQYLQKKRSGNFEVVRFVDGHPVTLSI